MSPFNAVKSGINRAGGLGLFNNMLKIKSHVKGVSGKTSCVKLTDRKLFPLAKGTVILRGSAAGLRGQDCGFQSVRETLDKSIS